MKFAVVRNGKKTFFDAAEGVSVKQAMLLSKTNSQAVMPVVNGRLAHPDFILSRGDELELLSVVYGG